jgi:Cdc6-like AAA superfamily ATPase
MKTMTDFFFMRDGFQTFRLEPERHNFLLFGTRDRLQRDHLLDHLEEASYSLEGYKSVVIGDFGRGKTHQSKNLEYEIESRELTLYPVYVKCIEFKAKEPFSTFFKELVMGIPSEHLQKLAKGYEEKRSNGSAPALESVIGDEDVARVFKNGLAAPNIDMVRLSMRWLGGEQKLDMNLIAGNLPSLQVSKQFGAVLKGIVQLFRVVDEKVPIFLVDEAERFSQVTNTDAYWSWLASLRELTEIVGVALIFFIGSKSRDDLPAMFLSDEVMTRIGVRNYVEFYNQGREDLRNFLGELFQTIIKKGDLPDELKPVLEKRMETPSDTTVPKELTGILADAGEELETYPFTRDAFERFIEDCATSDLSNKPREVLILVQKAAGKAMRIGRRLIDESILEDITREGI